MSKIYISYRRADSAFFVGRLSDSLVRSFGRDRILIDIDDIQLGVDFRYAIAQRIDQASVVVAVIGNRWLDFEPDGRRRIDDDSDFVRMELEIAFARRLPVIPLLIDDAFMPRTDELPSTLQELSYRQSLRIGYSTFRRDIDRLSVQLERLLERGQPTATLPPPLDDSRKSARFADDVLLDELKSLTRAFFTQAGRPIAKGPHTQLLGPEPIWIARALDPSPEEVIEFAGFLNAGQGGFLIYQGGLPPNTSVTLDRYRVEGRPIVPISINTITSGLSDGNSTILLADIERSYESLDNLFDTKNAIVDERFFFGRSELLAQVGSALTRGEHVLVTGLRKCGKTSFLNILRQHLASHPVCFVDLQRYDRNTDDWPLDLFQYVLKAFDGWGRRNFADWGDDNAPLVQSGGEFIDLLNDRRSRQIERGNHERFIIIMDEGERVFPASDEKLAAQRYTRAASALRVLGQSSQSRFLSIIAADLRPMLNRFNLLPDGSTNPFFGFFQEVPLPLLSRVAVNELLKGIGSAMGLTSFSSEYVDELYRLSGGHPSITRMIAAASYRVRSRSNALEIEDLPRGLNEMAETDTLGYFIRANLWGLMSKSEQITLIEHLRQSQPKPRHSFITRRFHASKPPTSAEARAQLISQGLLREGQITIGVLSDWISEQALIEA